MGNSSIQEMKSQYKEVVMSWVNYIREGYAGHVIRRTGKSLNCDGQPISGLAQPIEQIILLDLLQWEKDNLEEIATRMIEDGSGLGAAMFGAGWVSICSS